MKQQAIALCRVSTAEQKLNNSLSRQEESVHQAAKDLNVDIVKIWSGDVSSRVGKNIKRKDLVEMREFCKSQRSIKYLIVDEVDRFMRSVKEMFYWIVEFEQLGVKVWFTSNPELNADDAKASLFLSLDGYKGEGSNEERIKKGIRGLEHAINIGRYPFHPKPGYKKGSISGVHEPDEITFLPFQEALKHIISYKYTPTEALKELMKTPFKEKYKRFDMDKFRRYAIDPYYAGIVEMDRQVKARNENGLHQPMITIDEHKKLKAIFDGTYKPRGKAKHYNPAFPMNKMLQCAECSSKFTGAKKSNGYKRGNGKLRSKPNYYHKYRCRGCKKEYHRSEVHNSIESHINSLEPLSHLEGFREALETVWRQRNRDKIKQAEGLKKRLKEQEELKSSLVVSFARSTPAMQADIQIEIDKVKHQINRIETQIEECKVLDEELMDFVEFAMDYTNDLKADWWELDGEERQRCQQLLFLDGIYMNSDKKVSTPKISSFYTYKKQKTSSKTGQIVSMVELVGTAPTSIG